MTKAAAPSGFLSMAAAALGALRAVAFANAWDTEWLWVDLERNQESGIPGLTEATPVPAGVFTRPQGLLLAYADNSAIALRQNNKGLFRAPHAPLPPRTWTTDLADDALGPGWKPAPGAPRGNGWLAPLSPLDRITPWCPVVCAPRALWAQRDDAVGALRMLLAHAWRDHPGGVLARNAISMGREKPDGPVIPIVSDAFANPDNGGTQPGQRYWMVQALGYATGQMFPGRLGWSCQQLAASDGRVFLHPTNFFSQGRIPSFAVSAHDLLRWNALVAAVPGGRELLNRLCNPNNAQPFEAP